jgi:hypothetical protein
VKTEKEYDLVYSKCKAKAIGEVSTCYFHFPEESIPDIKQKLGDIPVIIILREPVERVWSGYKHFVRQGREQLSFTDALENEQKRKANRWDFMWYYTEISFYAEQARRWKAAFTNTLFILNEELEQEPVKTMQEIFRFIGVDDQFVPDTATRYNISDPQSHNIWFSLFFANPIIKHTIKPLLNAVIKEDTKRKLMHKLRKKNTAATPKLEPALREELKKKYTADIAALEKVILKDLSKWK